MPQRYNGGIDLTWPKTGERGWDSTVFRQFVIKIADHDHTGGGRGRQLSGAALGTNAFSGTSLRLDNAQWFRGRNVANTADLNLLRANTSNELEFGITAVAETFRTTNLFVNTSATSAVPANFANLSDGAAAAKFLAPVGALGVTFQSNQASGDSISLEYVNNSVPVFYQVVSAAGDMAFYPGGTKKISIGATGTGPTSDNNYKLGTTGTRFSETHTANLYSPNIIDDTGVDVSIGGATKWQFDSAGVFFPSIDGSYDIGKSSKHARALFASQVQASSSLTIGINTTNFITVNSSGGIEPLFGTQDLGTLSDRWQHGYFDGATISTVTTGTVNAATLNATGTITGNAVVSTTSVTAATVAAATSVTTAALTATSITGLTFTTFTPTITNSGDALANKVINYAGYMQIGKLVLLVVDITFDFTGSSGVGSFATIGNLPVTAADLYGNVVCNVGTAATFPLSASSTPFGFSTTTAIKGLCGSGGAATFRIAANFIYRAA